MPNNLEQSTVSLTTRQELIQSFPCFATLTKEQSKDLALHMVPVRYAVHEQIVVEHDLIDNIYIIIHGEAEVTRQVMQRRKTLSVPVAVLRAGEGIGLNDTGFYSSTGKRTATVTAVTEMVLLRLELADLYAFLKKNDLELSMYAASLQMLRMRFIKQSLPFAKLSHERLRWLADRVEDLLVPAGTVLFKQGEQGDKCYLIRSGQVEIILTDESGQEHQLALLKPPVLFGEATLITHSPRNATARAAEDCELLVLRHDHLSELIESEHDTANMFMTLMIDRSRPMKNIHVTVHERVTADGQSVTILKNPDNSSYFKLSAEGKFIWDQLDGEHTMQEITLDLANQYHVFAPDIVAGLISKLTKAGFISNLEIHDEASLKAQPLWVKVTLLFRRILTVRFAIGDADSRITKVYDQYVHYLFTPFGQIILALLAVMGFVAFIYNTPNVLLFFSFKHSSMLLALGLIPLSLVKVLLHELGHAFTIKAYGREVHYIGIGWDWVYPQAFTDTSDMWLSTRKPRMLVNFAGVYVDTIVAGVASLLTIVIPNPYVQSMLWLFALYTYLGGFRMLSPLSEVDGYYILMDWMEKNHLRQAAVVWLVKTFPKCIRQPHLFKQYKAEVVYWVIAILYLVLASLLTLTVIIFIFSIVGIKSNPYISLGMPLLVVLVTCLSIIAEIRQQAD